jgi:hypothetical protein
MPGLVSWQCIPSQFVPLPVHGPLPLHWCCDESSMHLPLTGHPLSLVHQQHWTEPPHCPWLTSHVVLAGQALSPPRLQKGATTEQPALSVNGPPVQLL